MKKLVAFGLGCVMMLALAACSKPASSVGSTSASSDYVETIKSARSPEYNDISTFNIVTGPEDKLYDAIFSGVSGFEEDAMDTYAISVSVIITKAYGVAIIKPAEGKVDAVVEQVDNFVLATQKSCENYLHDQYEIAKAAIVKVAPTGEVLLAMCEDAETVMANMEAALAK